MLNIVNEIGKDDGISNDLKKDYPNKIEKIEEASSNYISEKDLKFLKTEFPDKWKCLTKKLAYPYEYFKSMDDYQKPINDLKIEDFSCDLKKNILVMKKERTKENIKIFNLNL